MDKRSKNIRTLDMYARLCEGRVVNKAAAAKEFGVDERSIQRDIDDIRAFLDERAATDSGENRQVVYDRMKKGFVMEGAKATAISNSEVLAVTKILLESRAFTKKELNNILDKMVEGCVPLKNMKLVSDLIANEKYHYVELRHKSAIKDKLWEIGESVKEHNLLEIKYTKAGKSKEYVTRVVEPVGIVFSEYYFYLNANIVEKNESGHYESNYEYPAIFRLDRIKSYRKMTEKFRVPYANRFEEGQFRKRIQFMHMGKLVKLQFRFTGKDVESILDRLPTAREVSRDDSGVIIEAEVYGKGILMWLLSQGTMVEVLKPENFREEMKETIREMLERY